MLMPLRYRLVRGLIRLLLRCGVDERELEMAVLRHQPRILPRGATRPRFTTADRAFLAAAAQLLSRDRWRSFLVGPDTLVRWHRDLRWRRGRPCRPPGRPPLDPQLKHLILRLGRENPRWGYLRIRGETPEARDRRVGHDHRHGASPERPRPGAAADRTDVDPVPPGAGLWPAVLAVPVRG